MRVDAPGVKHLGPHFFTGDASPRWATRANPGGVWADAVSDDSVVLHLAYSYMADVEAKAHRSCPDEFLEAARRGDRAKVKAANRPTGGYLLVGMYYPTGERPDWGGLAQRVGAPTTGGTSRSIRPARPPARPASPAAQVKACFVIDQDQDAFMAAAQGRAAVEDFFYSRMVLSEGARIRCTDPGGLREGWCTLTHLPRFLYLMEKLGLYRRIHGPQILLRQQERAIQRALREEGGRRLEDPGGQ